MSTVPDTPAPVAGSATAQGPGIREWTPGFSDWIGDRYLDFDLGSATSLERLRFKPELGDSPIFEAALRERIEHLEHLQHPSIGAIRSLVRYPGTGLVLESKHTAGRRLSQLFQLRGEVLALDFIRQLTPVLVALHRGGDGVVHGVLSADRIIVTREGRLVVVEHVLGSAIAALQLSASRWRSESGLAIPAGTGVTVDARLDLVQLGFLALSLLVGRRLGSVDYPANIERLVGECAIAPTGRSAEAAWLRRWIERALQIGPEPFESAHEALDTLSELSEAGNIQPVTVDRSRRVAPEPPAPSLIDRTAAIRRATLEREKTSPMPMPPLPAPSNPASQLTPPPMPALSASMLTPPPMPVHNPTPVAGAPTPVASLPASSSPSPAAGTAAPGPWGAPPAAPIATSSYPASSAPSSVASSHAAASSAPPFQPVASAKPAVSAAASSASTQAQPPAFAASPTAKSSPEPAKPVPVQKKWLVPSLALLAVGEAMVIAGLMLLRPSNLAADVPVTRSTPPVETSAATPPPAPTPAPAAVVPPAAANRAGSGPATGAAGATHATESTPTPAPALPEPAPAPKPSAAERFGGIKVTSPIAVQVFEADKLVGSSAGPIAVLEGSHPLDLVNDALEFKFHVTAIVKPGQMASVSVPIPNGKLSINAIPWANVTIDGKDAGQTPLANLSVPIGDHDVVFKHPQFGEQRQKATVKVETPSRISVQFQKTGGQQ